MYEATKTVFMILCSAALTITLSVSAGTAMNLSNADAVDAVGIVGLADDKQHQDRRRGPRDCPPNCPDPPRQPDPED